MQATGNDEPIPFNRIGRIGRDRAQVAEGLPSLQGGPLTNCRNCRSRRSSPSLISLSAYVDAIMAGADEADADNIARAIEARPWPTYEERMAVFSPAGPWKPSREPFTPHAARKSDRADL